MIHVCTSNIGYMVLGNECFLLGDGALSECQLPRGKHAFYGMFSSGLIPMRYALKSLFCPFVAPDLWAASGRSCLIQCLPCDKILGSTYSNIKGFLFYPLPPRNPVSRMRWPMRASRP